MVDLCCFGLMPWQCDGQFGAALGSVPSRDLTAEILDDSIGDRQAEAETIADALGGEERIEDAADNLRFDAGAIVGHADQHCVVGGARGDPDPRIGLASDSVDGVTYEIEDDLLELNGMPHDPEIRRD